MRSLSVNKIKEVIKKSFIDINYNVSEKLCSAMAKAQEAETESLPKEILNQLLKNHKIARTDSIPICQDTGMAVVLVSVGQDVHFIDGDITEAINLGVKEAYDEGYLRKSIVDDPVFGRKNTGNNCPAIIYYDIVPGDRVELLIIAKGFGSENMSKTKMLKPSDGVDGIKDFIIETVKEAGPNPCPPIIVGVGIGGTLDKATVLSKKATARDIDTYNKDIRYKNLEIELLDLINNLNIGPAGMGGITTALKVNIEYYPTHIAGMPVAVNILCHAARHAHIII